MRRYVKTRENGTFIRLCSISDFNSFGNQKKTSCAVGAGGFLGEQEAKQSRQLHAQSEASSRGCMAIASSMLDIGVHLLISVEECFQFQMVETS
jgi:hypothetical protein